MNNVNKSEALEGVREKLNDLRSTKGVDYPELRKSIPRLSKDALNDLSDLIFYLRNHP